jgi:hypothetical protein
MQSSTGFLLRPIFQYIEVPKITKVMLAETKHFAETGIPHPDKIKALEEKAKM